MAEQTDSEKERAAVALHEAGKSGVEIAAALGISRSLVSLILRRNNCARPKSGRRATLALDHSAFDALSPESNYWTGFLFADGCVHANSSGSPQLIVDIAVKDRAYLERFRAFLKSEHAITDVFHKASTYGDITVQNRKSVAFRVRSKQLVAALAQRGLVVGKKLRIPNIEMASSRDFWRGCVDGDGCVRLDTDRNGYDFAQIHLCGQRPLIENYQQFLAQHEIAANITKTSSGVFQIATSNAKAVLIARLLYRDATVFLDRKMETAQAIFRRFGVE